MAGSYSLAARKVKLNQPTTIIWCITILILLVECLQQSYAQAVTRDPRFYSREGDFNFKWPNPGDPDYG